MKVYLQSTLVLLENTFIPLKIKFSWSEIDPKWPVYSGKITPKKVGDGTFLKREGITVRWGMISKGGDPTPVDAMSLLVFRFHRQKARTKVVNSMYSYRYLYQ